GRRGGLRRRRARRVDVPAAHADRGAPGRALAVARSRTRARDGTGRARARQARRGGARCRRVHRFRETRVKHKVKRVHFVGIGGAGMRGIAGVLVTQGYGVSGSDLSESAATRRLAKLGATVCIGHRAENVAKADAVVVSTAVTTDNPEVLAARERGIPVVPRALMLA